MVYPSVNPIPAKAGVGFRHPHYQEIITTFPSLAWLELHPENFFAEGGMAPFLLEKVAAQYPLSFHGVGLSLGRADALDKMHMKKLKLLVDRYQPGLVSEHISWGAIGQVWANDLLPLPYTEEALAIVVAHVNTLQDYLGRQILVENPSSYLEFTSSMMPEYTFIAEVVRQTGCGIVLDINNMYVAYRNHGMDLGAYIEALPDAAIKEIHLAGHATVQIEGRELLIDDHGSQVTEAVWAWYQKIIHRIGARPTLIEWDMHIPPLAVLIEEAEKAEALLERSRSRMWTQEQIWKQEHV